ncbi:type 1 glutamine amidotransferase [Ktedonosporobacter rubrisoli]|nr:type 1 glutamine amidotransferase [Ktedonosporobacter rubrisoli]
MKRVLALQHSWENSEGYVGKVLRQHHIAYDMIKVETEPIPEPTHYAAIVAFGGPQHVYETDKYPFFITEQEMWRMAVEHEIPCLGICLGGQALAKALGGSVQRHTTSEIGFFDIPFTEEGSKDPLYAGLPGYQKVFHWHEDAFDLPPGAIRLASNENTKNQAFRYGNSTYGLQYHIEVDASMLDLWFHQMTSQEEIIKSIGRETYEAIERDKQTQQSTYEAHTRIMFENFLKISKLI